MDFWIAKNRDFFKIPDWQLVAITAYGEARGEGRRGMHAVINVIRNRTLALRRFGSRLIYKLTGNPYHSVILRRWQFSVFNIRDINRPLMERLADRDEFIRTWHRDEQLKIATTLALKNHKKELPDITGGADHYIAVGHTAFWTRVYEFIGRIGNHLFYRSGVLARGIFRPEAYAKEHPILRHIPLPETFKRPEIKILPIILIVLVVIIIIIFKNKKW